MIDLPISPLPQQTTEWCWIASILMVARFLGVHRGLTECQLAERCTGGHGCCRTPCPPSCIRPGSLADIGRTFASLGIDCVGPDEWLSLPTLVAELDAGRPVVVVYAWYQGGGHVAVVHGYTDEGLFLVNDPWFGPGMARYEYLREGYGGGTWLASFGRFTAMPP